MNWKTGSPLVALGAVVLLLFWLWTPDKPRGELEARYLAAPGDLMRVGPVGSPGTELEFAL